MSQNNMISGYSIKLPSRPKGKRIAELVASFDNTKLNEWQWMYDEGGYECIVYLTASHYPCGDVTQVSVSMIEMLTAHNSAITFSTTEPTFSFGLDAPPELFYFVKIWDNGSDMGTIFKREES